MDFKDPQIRNWKRAALAVTYLRNGIESFVDIQARHQHAGVIDYVKSATGLSKVHCTQCAIVENILPEHATKKHECPHNRNRGFCNCNVSKTKRGCPNRVCGNIYDKIIIDHNVGNPNWRNTNPAQWTTNYWEVVKCFLQEGTDRYVDKASASETDILGLLSICLNCIPIRNTIDNIDKFEQVLNTCDAIQLIDPFALDENTYLKFMDQFIGLLQDKIAFVEDASAREAIQKIKGASSINVDASLPSVQSKQLDSYETAHKEDKAFDHKYQISSPGDVELIRERHYADAMKVIQKLFVLNWWNIDIRYCVYFLCSSLTELVLRNSVPLYQRKLVKNCSGIAVDIIRLGHTEIYKLLTSLSELTEAVFQNVECLPDTGCGCETRALYTNEYFNKMGTIHVTFSPKRCALRLRGEVYVNDRPEDLENLVCTFPFTCKQSRRLESIDLCDILLCHTQIIGLLCEIPALHTLRLSNVLCTEDSTCGCIVNKGNTCRTVPNVTTYIRKLEIIANSEICNKDQSSFKSHISPLWAFQHVRHAPNLSNLVIDGKTPSEDIQAFISSLPIANDSLAIKLVNMEFDRTDMLETLTQTRRGLELELVGVKVHDADAEHANLLKYPPANVVNWTSDGNSISARIKMNASMIILERVSPYHAWPANEYTSEYIANINGHSRKLLTRFGLQETQQRLEDESILFNNVTLNIVTTTKSQDTFFNTLFLEQLDQFQYCEIGAPVLKRTLGHGTNICGSEFIVAADTDAEVVANMCSSTSQFSVVLVDVDERIKPTKDISANLFPENMKVIFTKKDAIFDVIDECLERKALKALQIQVDTMRHLLVIVANETPCEYSVTRLRSLMHPLSLQPLGLRAIDPIAKTLPACVEEDVMKIEEILRRIRRTYTDAGKEVPKSLSQTQIREPQKPVSHDVFANDRDTLLGLGIQYGNFHAYINDTVDSRRKHDIIKKVKNVLKREAGDQRCFVHEISKCVEVFSYCGAQISCGDRFGTLGGFATSQDTLNALISKHMVIHPKVNIGTELKGTVLQPLLDTLDIAAVTMDSNDIHKCDTVFKDDKGKPKQCILFDCDTFAQTLQHNLVFIRGACTKVGLGEVEDFQYTGLNGFKHLMITDREDSTSGIFCTPGDSGAIVFSRDRYGRLYAMGMVVGKVEQQSGEQPRRYLALRLKEALEELSKLYGVTFTLCGQ